MSSWEMVDNWAILGLRERKRNRESIRVRRADELFFQASADHLDGVLISDQLEGT